MKRARASAASLAFGAALLGAGAATVGAGPYSPPGGRAGSSAIARTSPEIGGWAAGVAELVRGPAQIDQPAYGYSGHGGAADALGQAGTTVYETVSLGDGGSITLTFASPIRDGEGWDFAVFENGFPHYGSIHFCELAFVEVSSDGMNFFRFQAVSLTPTGVQLGPFEGMDPTNIHNLAGRDPLGWGTPFDLADLAASAAANAALDLNAITHVRLVDVTGSIDPAHASVDSQGNLINDPWPTPFNTGGFDLDAVAVRQRAPSPYQTWRESWWDAGQLADAALSGDSADADGDGVANLIEYALGGSPASAASAPLPVLAVGTGVFEGQTRDVLTLSFTRVADAGLAYVVEAADNLGGHAGWAPIFRSTGAQNIAGPLTVRDVRALGSTPRRFLRLRVESP
jgi:hypothetical protein